MAGLPKRELRSPLGGMLKVDQVHVLRHKVLVEGRSQRQVAKELGISRLTVKKYLTEAVPIRRETKPRARPVWEQGRCAARGAADRVDRVDRRQAAADGDAAARVARRRGPSRRRDAGERGRGRVAASAAGGVRAADVSAGRPRRSGLLRGARRSGRRRGGRRGSS